MDFRFMDTVWANVFMHPGSQSSLTRADAKHANLHISAMRAIQKVLNFFEIRVTACPQVCRLRFDLICVYWFSLWKRDH